ncbi:hypothetical protein AVEN_256211-1 [Araneus ventricosus]|uniref:DNA-directed DNA polymerase n=1 Tax=Araneus ventricosus TaxID=182803 RepID=A0A4Y2LQI3_ARAVE|nr:hypothetical protein AVEN_256211-1 [Araneus ventricosus]
MFPLCRSCVETRQQTICFHNDDERALTGTWVTEEVKLSKTKGYKISEIYEVYHFSHSSDTLFKSYIDTFLKIKQESSGWPQNCHTEEEKAAYVREYEEKEGVKLDPQNISKNPGRRQVAKLALNSFLGSLSKAEHLRSAISTPYIFGQTGTFKFLTLQLTKNIAVTLSGEKSGKDGDSALQKIRQDKKRHQEAEIVGFRTEKILYLGVRNKYCCVCLKANLEEGGGLITEAESSRSSDMLYTNVSPSDAEEELILASASDSRDCKFFFSNGGRTAIGLIVKKNTDKLKKIYLIQQLNCLEKLESKRERIVKKRKDLFVEIDDYDFRRRFRLTKESVVELTLLIHEKLESKSTLNNALSAVEQVLIALRFYVVASMQLAIADLFEVSRKFFNIAGFPSVSGALDCTFVRIASPDGEYAERFRCRKNYFALNVQTIVDSDLVIRNVVARWRGRGAHDSTIFTKSAACLTLQKNSLFRNYHLLGDSGYNL